MSTSTITTPVTSSITPLSSLSSLKKQNNQVKTESTGKSLQLPAFPVNDGSICNRNKEGKSRDSHSIIKAKDSINVQSSFHISSAVNVESIKSK